MADRHTEKKEQDNWIPVVTPDRRRRNDEHQNAKERQRQQQQRQNEFNPRDYKANTSWTNPFSFLGQAEPPTTTTKTTTTTTANRRRRSKMTDNEKTTTTAKELKEEMRWNNKPNKTSTILDVLEFKAELIEGLRRCAYRGNKQGHTFLIEDKDELRDRIKDQTAIQTTRPKAPQEPSEPDDINNDKLWERFECQELLYKKNVKRYELTEDYNKQIKDLLVLTFPGCANNL